MIESLNPSLSEQNVRSVRLKPYTRGIEELASDLSTPSAGLKDSSYILMEAASISSGRNNAF